MWEPIAVRVTESSQAGEARRLAAALARRLGFGESDAGKVALVVTEAATNLARHGVQGELLLRGLEEGGAGGIEVLALDRGPGMANPAECVRDGYSTAGSPGTGLGGIVRLSTVFDIYSVPGLGTALLARLRPGPPAPSRPGGGLEVGAVCRARDGEETCGDRWGVVQRPGRTVVVVSDGLGHGPAAAAASLEAVRTFEAQAHLGPTGVLEAAHAALRPTRGAAVAVGEVDLERRVVRFAGVGNIAGTVVSPTGSRRMVSHNGILGHEVRKIREFAYPWPAGALLVMHSDGLATQWKLERYPGLTERHPGLVAGVLYRDFARGRDDVAVVVAREPGKDTSRP